MDVIGIRDPAETQSRKEIEEIVKDHFLQTVRQDDSNRYEVHLPWIADHKSLPTDRILSEKRLINTHKKLEELGQFTTYHAVFEDWLKQGIIEEVPTEEVEKPGHYLPHRAVLSKSISTPVRPVFDASAHGKGSPSLNDCLEKEPNLLELIPTVMTEFQEKRIGVSADIR